MAQRITIVLETATDNHSESQARIVAEEARRHAQLADGFPVVVESVRVEPIVVLEATDEIEV